MLSKPITRSAIAGLSVASLLTLVSNSVQGAIVVNYTMSTAPLVAHPAAPFYLQFQFFDASGNPSNNSLVVDNFDFGGGAAIGSPLNLASGVAGDLSIGVTLPDQDPFSITPPDFGFVQEFTPGATLSFRVSIASPIFDAGPDQFSFQILEESGNPFFTPIATGNPSFSDSFFDVFVELSPTIATYGHNPGLNLPPSVGNDFTIPAGVAALDSQVPEPGTLTIFSVGSLIALVFGRRRGRRQPKAPAGTVV